MSTATKPKPKPEPRSVAQGYPIVIVPRAMLGKYGSLRFLDVVRAAELGLDGLALSNADVSIHAPRDTALLREICDPRVVLDGYCSLLSQGW